MFRVVWIEPSPRVVTDSLKRAKNLIFGVYGSFARNDKMALTILA
ncbi:hypothetical protein FHR96_000204 [Halomonas organivorans]|uniref:Uncharacterized protein n=1 Tax=Halomonas organivorans TaxID=257772 RepID=A0A7W5BVC8_9GAMM|nr:hypothetical protein [Halomonas organivorans]